MVFLWFSYGFPSAVTILAAASPSDFAGSPPSHLAAVARNRPRPASSPPWVGPSTWTPRLAAPKMGRSWEKCGKNMGKPWENGDLMVVQMGFNGGSMVLEW